MGFRLTDISFNGGVKLEYYTAVAWQRLPVEKYCHLGQGGKRTPSLLLMLNG